MHLQIGHEIGHQLFRTDKTVRLLTAEDMLMIPLAAFIVITQHPPAIDHIDQPVFIGVFGWRNRTRYLPDHDLDDAAIKSSLA